MHFLYNTLNYIKACIPVALHANTEGLMAELSAL